MNEILKKLADAGLAPDMIEKLQTGLGETFESTLLSGGLKAAAEKVGIDTTNLPEIDFTNMAEAAKEFMGTDVDGDGKTGIMEAVDNLKEVATNTDMAAVKEFAEQNASGIFAKIKAFFGGNP